MCFKIIGTRLSNASSNLKVIKMLHFVNKRPSPTFFPDRHKGWFEDWSSAFFFGAMAEDDYPRKTGSGKILHSLLKNLSSSQVWRTRVTISSPFSSLENPSELVMRSSIFLIQPIFITAMGVLKRPLLCRGTWTSQTDSCFQNKSKNIARF